MYLKGRPPLVLKHTSIAGTKTILVGSRAALSSVLNLFDTTVETAAHTPIIYLALFSEWMLDVVLEEGGCKVPFSQCCFPSTRM